MLLFWYYVNQIEHCSKYIYSYVYQYLTYMYVCFPHS